MKIKIVKAHKCMKVGDTPDVAAKYAEILIGQGIAIDPSKEEADKKGKK